MAEDDDAAHATFLVLLMNCPDELENSKTLVSASSASRGRTPRRELRLAMADAHGSERTQEISYG